MPAPLSALLLVSFRSGSIPVVPELAGTGYRASASGTASGCRTDACLPTERLFDIRAPYVGLREAAPSANAHRA